MQTLFKTVRAVPTLSTLVALLCLAPPALQAQFDFVTNNGAITITAYTGPGGDVVIPSETNDLPVATIGYGAFSRCTTLTNVTIPNTVTTIGAAAFTECNYLASVTFGNSVKTIGAAAFFRCYSLTNITIPVSVTEIPWATFHFCVNLTSIYFQGNAPALGDQAFAGDPNVTVYYLPGSTGWGPTYGGPPTAPWCLSYPVILRSPPAFGVLTNGFGFVISWATNASVVVEACSNLGTPAWSPFATNAITMDVDPLTDGWSYFSDPDWTNHPTRFYRLWSP